MSFDVVDNLNWLAVVVATASYYVLAGPWFAEPLFGPGRSTATKADRLVRDHGRIPPHRTRHRLSAHRRLVMVAAEPPRRPAQRRYAEIVTPSHSYV
jgi:hypothetical protein